MLETLLERIEPEFAEILARARDGKELTVEMSERLLKAEGPELLALVLTADEMRKRKVGEIVTYVINRNINFTNICIGTCRFCAFRRRRGGSDAYLLTPDEISAKVREAIRFGATEVCIQGGLHPDFRLANYVEILEAVRAVSKDIHIHAFSPAELNHAAERGGLSIEEVIKTLRDAGLNSVPGTAAEILVDRVRNIICPDKIDSNSWVEIIKTCHRLGLPSTSTMLYGHVESAREIAEHLAVLREVQRETGGFTEFVPLAFLHQNTQLQRMGVRSSRRGAVDLRLHATARLMLSGYIDNIQASWVKLGPRLAQLILSAGANDFSGTLIEENISRAAGGHGSRMLPAQLEQMIVEAGRIPRQRTTTYELL
ncbi:MAG: 5-amino-6-(D-ribitylamino)uracil--L-tyrosine 4-hydroxyphenyl transferase CofH [Candidatus Hadarchaeota archaeon]|nr:5-amino-6-(D-ribitylamino)uracil--L-tyrosine 4-hydroxyphenyl transferase CofH [Candidatus Hadarchaeota archaeon]